MSWHVRRLAAFDTETTGVDCDADRVVAAAVCVVGAGLPTVHHGWLVDPGVEIPDGATAVHGVTTARARREGGAPPAAIDELTHVLAQQVLAGVPIVAFNARFDLTLLDREARRHGVVPLVDRVGGAANLLVVDPYVLDRQFDGTRIGKRTLAGVCAHYRVPLTQAHVAGADALAAARVAWRMGEAYPELRALELGALHRAQIGWAAEQAARHQAHLRAEGSVDVVEAAWPLVPAAAASVALAA